MAFFGRRRSGRIGLTVREMLFGLARKFHTGHRKRCVLQIAVPVE